MCLSSAITTCPEDTLIDIGSPEFKFIDSYFEGAQNLFCIQLQQRDRDKS